MIVMKESFARLFREIILGDAMPEGCADTRPLPSSEDGTALGAGETTTLLVDEKEACRLLGGLCGKTLYNFRQQGLPSVKIGSRVMYSPRALARWVQEQQQT
jgi:hypothetical protein